MTLKVNGKRIIGKRTVEVFGNISTFWGRWKIKSAQRDGFQHIYCGLEEEHGRLVETTTRFNGKYSTDQEVRTMWNLSTQAEGYQNQAIKKYLDNLQRDMFESFLDMTQFHSKHSVV